MSRWAVRSLRTHGAFAPVECQYVAPVYVGDTVTCVMTVTERDEAKRTVSGTAIYTNQDGKDVIQATFSGFPADVRLAH